MNNDDGDYLTNIADEISKLNYQKMIIFNKIREIDEKIEELNIKTTPLKTRINLRKKKKLLEIRKVELRKFEFFEQVVKNLNTDLISERSKLK